MSNKELQGLKDTEYSHTLIVSFLNGSCKKITSSVRHRGVTFTVSKDEVVLLETHSLDDAYGMYEEI
jgi:hypothetical protein